MYQKRNLKQKKTCLWLNKNVNRAIKRRNKKWKLYTIILNIKNVEIRQLVNYESTLRCRPTVVLPVKSTAIMCQWSAIDAFCTASLLKLTKSNVLLSDLVISSCYCCNPIVMLCV